MFQSLYGAQVTTVTSTPNPRDDLELARKLNEAARLAVESPGLQRMMLDRAYTLAMKDPTGATDATFALDRLRQLFPADGDLWDERALELQDRVWKSSAPADRLLAADVYCRLLMLSAERQTRAGKYVEATALARRAADTARTLDADAVAEVKDLTAAITERQRLDRRATELIEKLVRAGAAASNDIASLTEAAELLAGVLPRRDDLRSLEITQNPTLNQLLTIARLPDREISDAQAAWMGDYFRQAADRPQALHRTEMLRAAAAWYAQFLAMHLPLDSERLRVLLASQQVQDALKKDAKPLRSFDLPCAGASLLATVDPARHRVSGTWTVTTSGAAVNPVTGDGGLGTTTTGLLTMPVAPGNAYEVTLQFVGDGATDLGLVLPVGSSSVAVSRSGSDCVIGDIKTQAYRLTSALPMLAQDAQRHTLYVRVVVRDDRAAVLVGYDGYEMGRWEGRTADLTAPADLQLPNRAAMGVFARGGKAMIADISLHTLRETPLLLHVPGPREMPLDGTRPRDASVTRLSDLAASFTHHGATATFDPNLPGGVQLTIGESTEDVRVVRAGFTAVMADSTNLAPLRMEYPRYLQLLKMLQSAPRPYAPADLQKLAQLFGEHEKAVTSGARQRAEHALFTALHLLAERYQRASLAWAKSVQKSTSAAEFNLIVEFGKRG